MKLLTLSIAIISSLVPIELYDIPSLPINTVLWNIARSLNIKIGRLLVDINTYQFNVDYQLANLKPIDFHLSTQPKLVNLQKQLSKLKNKKCVHECRNRLNNKTDTLRYELQNIVKKNLTDEKNYLDKLHSTLTKIQNRLFGSALRAEINRCNKKVNPNCKLQGNFTWTTLGAEEYSRNHKRELTSRNLTMIYAKRFAFPVIADKVENEIVLSVKACIKRINY